MPTETLKDLLQQDATRVFSECTSPDWDGYGAMAVTPRHYDDLLRLINWLPEGIEKPEVVAQPDGCLALDWWRDRKYTFTLLLKKERLIYAALVGDYKNYGREAVEADPSVSKSILLQYFKSNPSPQ